VLEDRALSGATIRRKLAALSSLFEYLCEKNAVDFNPVKGTKRPKVDSNEGKTPALGDHQARALLDAPDPATLKGQRDRAMLAVLLYHGLRRQELCLLKVRDIHDRRGVPHLRVHGKGGKTRYVPLHPASAERLHIYLEAAGHATTPDAALFQPTRKTGKAITADGVYKCVLGYAAQARINVEGFGVAAILVEIHDADFEAQLVSRVGFSAIGSGEIGHDDTRVHVLHILDADIEQEACAGLGNHGDHRVVAEVVRAVDIGDAHREMCRVVKLVFGKL
jgi:hypothetical protein